MFKYRKGFFGYDYFHIQQIEGHIKNILKNSDSYQRFESICYTRQFAVLHGSIEFVAGPLAPWQITLL